MRDITVSTTNGVDNIETKVPSVSCVFLIFILYTELFVKVTNDDNDDLNLFGNYIEKSSVCYFDKKF